MTQYEALRKAGWVQPIDYVLAALTGLLLVAAAVVLFSSGALLALVVLATAIISAQVWLLVLAYRCSHFVLLARADINLLPTESAKLALTFQSAAEKPHES